jgi:hypothetical protein
VGLFKSIGKAFKKVAKVVGKPLVSTIARTVVGSVPVLGGVVSAVGVVKSSIHPPTRANTANLSARTGAPAFGHPHPMLHRQTHTRRSSPGSKPTRIARKRAGSPGRRVTEKQRAARLRFAKAAKRGRIKKGQRL